MKETKIAKENIDIEKNFMSRCTEGCEDSLKICQTHKQTCQRWLEFLGDFDYSVVSKFNFDKVVEYGDKIKDLKQAIKLYKGAGI